MESSIACHPQSPSACPMLSSPRVVAVTRAFHLFPLRCTAVRDVLLVRQDSANQRSPKDNSHTERPASLYVRFYIFGRNHEIVKYPHVGITAIVSNLSKPCSLRRRRDHFALNSHSPTADRYSGAFPPSQDRCPRGLFYNYQISTPVNSLDAKERLVQPWVQHR